MKKYFLGILSSVFVVAALVGFRDQIGRVWAAPDRVAGVEKKVEKQESVQDQISKLVIEQNTRLERQEVMYEAQQKVSEAQVKSLEKQLEYIGELKKKR